METLTRFIHEDDGQNLVEYALLAGLVALVVMTAVGSVGTSISGLYGRLAERINGIAP
jgi:pilus assembly protein Flp/PilA